MHFTKSYQKSAIPKMALVRKIKLVHGYRFWIDQVNAGIEELNALIEKYNATHSIFKKIQLLQLIDKTQQSIDDKIPDIIVNELEPYRRIFYDELFYLITHHKKLLNIKATSEWPESISHFTYLLDTMEPERASRLLKILISGSKEQVRYLEDLYEPTHSHYQIYQDFLTNYRVEYFSGSNSKNFLVIPNHVTSPKYILKIEDRLDATKEVERQLRKKLETHAEEDNFLVKNYTDRRTTCDLGGDRMTRTMVFMDYFEGKTLEELACLAQTHEERIDLAIDVGIAQIELALKTQAFNVVNTDYKNENLLFFQKSDSTTKLQIKIADCKAYCAADEQGFLITSWDHRYIHTVGTYAPELMSMHLKKSTRAIHRYIHTVGTYAPELMSKHLKESTRAIRIEPIHAYIIAKNIYKVLIGNNKKALEAFEIIPGLVNPMFELPIFELEKGCTLKALLMNLGKFNPNDRSSLVDSLQILRELKYGPLYHNVWRILRDHQFDKELPSKLINDYIDRMYSQFVLNKENPDFNKSAYENQDHLAEAVETLAQIKKSQFGAEDSIMQAFIQTSLSRLLTDNDMINIIKELKAVKNAQGPLTQYLVTLIKQLSRKNYFDYFNPDERLKKANLLQSKMSHLPLLERERIFIDDESLLCLKMEIRNILFKRLKPTFWLLDTILSDDKEPSLEYIKAKEIHNESYEDSAQFFVSLFEISNTR